MSQHMRHQTASGSLFLVSSGVETRPTLLSCEPIAAFKHLVEFMATGTIAWHRTRRKPRIAEWQHNF